MIESYFPTFCLILACLFNLPLFFNFFDKNTQEEFGLKTISFFGGFFLSLTLSMLLFMPILFANEIKNNTILLIYPIIIFIYLIIRFIIFISNYLKIMTANIKPIYIRDIFVDYSPAVLSLLINHKIENKKDFAATVLNLHAKKVIGFNRINNKLEILDLKNNSKIINLTKDEEYIYHVLTNQELFDKNIWYNLIQTELNQKNFVKKGKKNIVFQIIKWYLLLFALTFLMFILFVLAVLLMPGEFFKNIATNYFNYNIVLSIMWILILTPFQLLALEGVMLINKRKYLKDKMNYYTEHGALELLKWKKFANFINDFSTIDEAPAESIVLWEKYLAYSMSLNINKSYNSPELKNLTKDIKDIKFT